MSSQNGPLFATPRSKHIATNRILCVGRILAFFGWSWRCQLLSHVLHTFMYQLDSQYAQHFRNCTEDTTENNYIQHVCILASMHTLASSMHTTLAHHVCVQYAYSRLVCLWQNKNCLHNTCLLCLDEELIANYRHCILLHILLYLLASMIVCTVCI